MPYVKINPLEPIYEFVVNTPFECVYIASKMIGEVYCHTFKVLAGTQRYTIFSNPFIDAAIINKEPDKGTRFRITKIGEHEGLDVFNIDIFEP